MAMRPGLTEKEREALAKLDWYIVWHEDIYHVGSEREPAEEVARYLSPEKAEAEAKARGGPADATRSKWEGYRTIPANCRFLEDFDEGRLSLEDAKDLLQKASIWGRIQDRLEFLLGCVMVIGIPLLVVGVLWWLIRLVWHHFR